MTRRYRVGREEGMKHFSLGQGFSVDLATLIDTRLLVQANSGGGKSHMLRRLLEQTHGAVQHLVIDLEGEFASLREKYDYVLAAKGGDTPADPRSAALLAERLLDLKVSAIVDIYELKHADRVRFVKLFLEALVNAPKTLWHPALVIVDEAHVFCLDADTELLTASGWKRHESITTDDLAAAFDVQTGAPQFEPIQRVIRKKHSGAMVSLQSDGIDCVVTPEHRVVLRREQRAKGRRRLYPWTFCNASDVPHHVYIPTGIAKAGGRECFDSEFLRVMGWVITDGCITQRGRRGLSISQAVTTQKNGVKVAAVMGDVLARMGCRGAYRRTRANRADSIDFYLGVELSERLRVWLGTDIHRVPRAILESGSRADLESLYQGLLEGDGTARRAGWKVFYPGKNSGLADDFQELATRLGISTVKKLVPQNQQWVVLISKRRHHYIRKPKQIDYNGTVWCITIPSGAFVARRNGKVFVTGNCPQQGEAESAGAVIDLCTRGRKRGYCAVLATQRLSKLHKDAAAECNNKLIGRTGLDVDMKRAADELGFTTNEQRLALRALEAGQFYAFGPALARGVQDVKIGPVVTTHPKAGARLAFVAPPPTEKVRALLPKLADLPAEQEQRDQTVADLKRQIAELKRQVVIERHVIKGVGFKRVDVEKPVLTDADRALLEKLIVKVEAMASGLASRPGAIFVDLEDRLRAAMLAAVTKVDEETVQARAAFLRTIDAKGVQKILAKLSAVGAAALPPERPARAELRSGVLPPPRQTQRPVAQLADTNGTVTPAKQKVLNALAWMQEIGITPADKTQLALMAGVSPTSGGYFNNLGALRSAGLIEYPTSGTVALTTEGRALATVDDVPGTNAELHAAIQAKLPPAKWKILKALISVYPKSLTKDQLAEQIDVSPTSGGYFNNLGSLRSLGLIDYPRTSEVAARSVLFVEA